MIYRDEQIVTDPIYEDIFWFFYKEFVILMSTLGLLDMEEETFNWRKIAYAIGIAMPVMFICTLFTVTCGAIIFKIL